MAVSSFAATPPLTTVKILCRNIVSSGCPSMVTAAFMLHPFTALSDGNTIMAKKIPFISLCLKAQSVACKTQKIRLKASRSGEGLNLIERKGENEGYGLICPGCGVYMQDKDPNFPGYYQEKKESLAELSEGDEFIESVLDDEFSEKGGELSEGDEFTESFLDDEFSDKEAGGTFVDGIEGKIGESENEKIFEKGDELDWDTDDWEAEIEDEDNELSELDGFAPPGIGYGNITEEKLEKEKEKKRRLSKAERKRMAREAEKEKEEVTVCARCHSLRNYGQVKNQLAENLIPDFDFDRLIATRLMKSTGNDANVVVMVVDCVDFDGSFPKRAARSLFKALERGKDGTRSSKRLPKLVLVATKVDLLPSQISPTRLDRWVRHRAKAAGAPKLSRVYLVSARKDVGVRNFLSLIKELAGPRGNVWVIGAQNAGKSTLINALAKKEGVKITKLTEAAVPGTTLGILRIAGILPAKANMYDTPGLLHPYLISMRLNRDEQKIAEIRKELQPRTYRMKVGQAVHVGGLIRLDLNRASVQTIYVTVWASSNISLHMGRIENADEIFRKHVGVRLQPPIGVDRVPQLGIWEGKEIAVSGNSWDVNSIDIAAAGLGWFSLGLKGEATLRLWTYNGIEITTREPLVLDRAPFLERPGFWLPKAISETIGKQSKLEVAARERLQEDSTEELAEVPA